MSRQRRFNFKRYFQVLGISLAAVLCILVAILVLKPSTFSLGPDGGLTKEEIATVKTSGGKINVLLLGVDEGGLRTDCMMLVSYDTTQKKASLLSIPRDTRMYVGSKYQKINAAHAIKASNGKPIGAQGSVEAVSRLTGVPINYYVEMTFDDVAQCINLLGPVTFEIPDLYNDGVGMVYDDPVQGLHINLKPGVQELDGAKVVQLLRYRKNNMVNGKRNQYPNGDIGRIAMQQEFFKALVDQKLSADLILRLPALFKQVTKTVKTNFTSKDIMAYSSELDGFTSGNLKAFSLPGDAQTINGASYWICDIEETQKLIQTEFGYSASEITIDKASVGTNDKGSSGSSKETQKPKATANSSSPKDTSKATASPTKKAESDDDSDKTHKPTRKPDTDDSDESSPKPSSSAQASSSAKPSASSSAKPNADREHEDNEETTSTQKPATSKAPQKTEAPASQKTTPPKTEQSGNSEPQKENNAKPGEMAVPVKKEE